MKRKPKFGDTQRVDLPADEAERAWLVQLHPLWVAAAHDIEPIKSFGLSCYLQGALDALSPAFKAAHEKAFK